jgi:hypothetical protein
MLHSDEPPASVAACPRMPDDISIADGGKGVMLATSIDKQLARCVQKFGAHD